MSDQLTPKPREQLDQIRDAIFLKHYSYSIEGTSASKREGKICFITRNVI